MNKLLSCIEELKTRIKKHQDALSLNEFRTRVSLVDPLLRTLGWDVSDLDMVMPEYQIDTVRADYALLDQNSRPVAILEAKKLGSPLSNKDCVQMLNYAQLEGIAYAGLTNGDNWELYPVFKPGRLEDRKILNISIEKDSTHHSALRLLCLWRPNLCSGMVTEASAPILAYPGGRGPDPPPIIELPPKKGWISLAECIPRSEDLPLTVRCWNGTVRELKHYLDLARMIAELLFKDGLLTANDLPYYHGKGTNFIINTKPEHIDGTPFEYKRARPLPDTQIFMFIRANPEAVKRHSTKLLKRFGKDPKAHVHLKIN